MAMQDRFMPWGPCDEECDEGRGWDGAPGLAGGRDGGALGLLLAACLDLQPRELGGPVHALGELGADEWLHLVAVRTGEKAREGVRRRGKGARRFCPQLLRKLPPFRGRSRKR